MGDADKDAANKIHDSKARGLRSKLHLGIDEPPPNPYVSDDEFERQQLEGEIDGYEQVLALAEDASLDDDAFGPRLAQAIFAAWPPDYLDYCKRFLTFFERMPCPPDVGPRLEYEDWCECVDELHALAARCEQAGRRPESNKKYRLMLIKLLRVPGERAPVVEWPRAVNDVT
jgi:hypothetical protein